MGGIIVNLGIQIYIKKLTLFEMEIKIIKDLIDKNYSTRQIAKELNTSYANIRYWMKKYQLNTTEVGGKPGQKLESDQNIYERCLEMVSRNPKEYSYLFGLYLGDGCVEYVKGNYYSLSIHQDSKYTNLINKHKESILNFFGRNPYILTRSNCTVIRTGGSDIKFLFPKFGIGRKHLNKVILPKILIDNMDYLSLVEGLFQSDGSYYYDNHNKKYFYNFTNKSIDIIEIFKTCLDNLSIGYTTYEKKDGKFVVNIRKKSDVDRMIYLVGTKKDPK
jgi:DNA-binding transcriptional regulator WhiA